MAGVNGLQVDGVEGVNVAKYILTLGGVADAEIEQLNTGIAGSGSDRIKVYGPAFGVNIRNSHGRNGDDIISIQTQEQSPFTIYTIACGDILDVKVSHVSSDAGQSGTILYPTHPTLYMDNIDIGHIGALESTSNGGMVGIKGAGVGNIGVVNVHDISSRGLVQHVVQVFGDSMKIQMLNIERCSKNSTPAGAAALGEILNMNSTGTEILTLNIRGCSSYNYEHIVWVYTGTVDVLNLDQCTFNYPVFAGTESVVLTRSGNGFIKTLNVRDCCLVGTPNYLVEDQVGMTINIDGLYAPDTTRGIISISAAGTISAKNVYAPNATFGIGRFNSVLTEKVYSGGNINFGANPWFTYPAAGTVAAYGFDIQMDITKASRAVGSYFYNTNAAPGSGTIAAVGPVMNDGTTAANSFHLMADPTKVY
jgi:hypothetical protein